MKQATFAVACGVEGLEVKIQLCRHLWLNFIFSQFSA